MTDRGDTDVSHAGQDHWVPAGPGAGANNAIRTLLDLAPPKETVIREGELIEIPTVEVFTGDLLLVRPGDKIATDEVVEEGQSEVDESRSADGPTRAEGPLPGGL